MAGIPNIGLSNARLICRRFDHDWNRIENAVFEQLTEINGVGDVMADAFVRFFNDEENRKALSRVLEEIELEKPESAAYERLLENITFVITGSLERFANRKELVEIIESMGGKVSGSVSAKTDYLINNDITSGSTKNKTARELGVPIISEAQFLDWVENGIRP